MIQSEILKTNAIIPDIKDSLDFYQVLESGEENSIAVSSTKPDTDDLAMIQFTSGTTGKPKAAGLTHNNIVNNARFCADRANLSDNSILQVNVPLFHCFSNVLGSVGAMVTGTPMIYPNHSWNARHAIESISEHKTTIMYGTPTMYIDMLREIDNNPGHSFDFSSLEHSVCGASIMPTQIINRCQQEFSSTVLNWFGTTENSPLVSACYVNDRLDKVQTTIGRPLAHTEAKIVGDDGKIQEGFNEMSKFVVFRPKHVFSSFSENPSYYQSTRLASSAPEDTKYSSATSATGKKKTEKQKSTSKKRVKPLTLRDGTTVATPRRWTMKATFESSDETKT